MNRPTKKQIAEQVARLKPQAEGPSSSLEVNAAKLTAKQSSKRIRKQGI